MESPFPYVRNDAWHRQKEFGKHFFNLLNIVMKGLCKALRDTWWMSKMSTPKVNMCFNNFSYYLFLALPGLHCYMGSSLVAASGGCSLVCCADFSPWRLPLQSTGTGVHTSCTSLQRWLPGTSSTAVARGLSGSTACGSEIESVFPALAGRFFTTEPPGKPQGK